MHHFNGTELRCAPSICIAHLQPAMNHITSVDNSTSCLLRTPIHSDSVMQPARIFVQTCLKVGGWQTDTQKLPNVLSSAMQSITRGVTRGQVAEEPDYFLERSYL